MGREVVYIHMVQPEERIKGRGLQGRHVAIATRLIMDLVVHVFKTSVSARVRGANVKTVIAESVKLVVRQKQEQNVATERSILVGEDGSDL